MRHAVAAALIILALVAGIASSLAWAGNIGNNVYGIYSETFPGIQYNVLTSSDREGGFMGVWPSAETLLVADKSTWTEGGTSLKVTVLAGKTGGVWMQFGHNGAAVPPKVATDMSAYYGGTLEFSIKTFHDVGFHTEWNRGTVPYVSLDLMVNKHYGVPLDNQWHDVKVNLSAFTGLDSVTITSTTIPAVFSIIGATTTYDRTFWIDNIRWVKQASAQGPTSSAVLRNFSNDAQAGALTWNDNRPGASWQCAKQYIEYKIDFSSPSSWGIQIYTDNTAADANPRYTGPISTAPFYTASAAGLVASTNTAAAPLPMCWRISDYKLNTSTLTIAYSADFKHLYCPALGGDNQYYPWMFIKDISDPDFNTPAARNYTTVWDTRGIHYGEGEWGGASSPNYIYIGADFSGGMDGRTYKSNKLTMRLFRE